MLRYEGFPSVVWQIPGFLFRFCPDGLHARGRYGCSARLQVMFSLRSLNAWAVLRRGHRPRQRGRCHRPRRRASLNQAGVHGLHEGRRAKVEDEGGGDAPPSPCAPQDDRDPFPTPRRPRPPSLLVPAMSLPLERGILRLVGEAIAAKCVGTLPQALRTLPCRLRGIG